jgi:hypothetical protein
MAAAGGTALADKSRRRGPVQAFDDNGAAILANSQDDRDAPAAQMTGWLGWFFKSIPEASEELPQTLHDHSMPKNKSGCNQPQVIGIDLGKTVLFKKFFYVSVTSSVAPWIFWSPHSRHLTRRGNH